MKDRYSETALAQPLTGWLSEQGWTVRSEVRDCDIAAVKDEEILIVELKKTLNLPLLVQAVKRQRITDRVYVAIPRPSNRWKWNAQNRGVLHILRRLELGLILVSLDGAPAGPASKGRGPVEVVFPPKPLSRRKRPASRRLLLDEIRNRSGDFNTAGSTRTRLVTAYREKAIHVACGLLAGGMQSPGQLRALGTDAKTLSILYTNVYGWFARKGKGQYELTDHGRKDLECFKELSDRYLAMIRERMAQAKKEPGRLPRARSRQGPARTKKKGP